MEQPRQNRKQEHTILMMLWTWLVNQILSMEIFHASKHPPHHQQAIKKLRSARGSIVSVWRIVNWFSTLRVILWTNGGFTLSLFIYFAALATLIFFIIVIGASQCTGLLIPGLGVPIECDNIFLQPNQTTQRSAFSYHYDDLCGPNGANANWSIVATVPYCDLNSTSLSNINTFRGILFINSLAALFLNIIAFYALIYIMRNRGRYLPKTCRGVLASFTKGIEKGSLMVSYSWTNETLDIARKVASAFSGGKCWVDIRNILPGASIQDICTSAAAKCTAAYVFLTPEYLQSHNCSLELLNLEPKCIPYLCEHNDWIDDTDTLNFVDSDLNEGTLETNGDSIKHGTPLVSQMRQRKNTWGNIKSEHEDEFASLHGMPTNEEKDGTDMVKDEDDDDDEPTIDGNEVEDEEATSPLRISRVLKRNPNHPAKLIVIVTDEVEDTEELDEKTYEFHQQILRVLREQGHYLIYERDNVLKYFRYNNYRMVLQTLVLSKALVHIYRRQETTPAINENWQATSASMVKTWFLNIFYMLPIISGAVQLLITGRSFTSSDSSNSTANTITTALAVQIALLVWQAFSLRGTDSFISWMWKFMLLPFYRPIHRAGKFSKLPDTAHLLAVLKSLQIGKKLKIFASPTAPKYLKTALQSLSKFDVIDIVGEYEQPDFKFVCLDIEEGKSSLFSKQKYAVKVPPVLDDSGASMYWTRSNFPKVAAFNPKNIRTAFIKCGQPPKLETILVQMLKTSLGLPLRASLTIGRNHFKHIDFDVTSSKKVLVKRTGKFLQGLKHIPTRINKTTQKLIHDTKTNLDAVDPDGGSLDNQNEKLVLTNMNPSFNADEPSTMA
eukprot:m.14928 g.14928  ORF g.14928 m.14928 type:complete len:838 (+) comp4394_c0_seq2:154-2667(+)